MTFRSWFKNSGATASFTALTLCDNCDKPDVYVIIADEYADSASLSQAFGFNNTAFQTALRQRGFHLIKDSKANYNFTQYAVASLFKMNYLSDLDRRNSSKKDINNCYDAINQNELLTFFTASGYDVKNFSVFNLANEPAKAEYKFVPMGKGLIASQTFLQRLQRDLGYYLVTTFKLKSEIARYAYYTKENNEALLQLLRDETARKPPKPRFVFTHVEMPLILITTTARARARPLEFLTGENETDKEAYVGYVQYANKIFLDVIDGILKRSGKAPVIVFMGDHGFREFGNNDAANRRY